MKENKKEEIESELRARTQELKESKEQIQLLLDSTGEAIYGLDNDGNCNFANAACLRILRYKEASQLIGENMHDLIHHTKQDGTPYPIEECRIYQAFRDGTGIHIDDEILWRADGTCFPVEYMSYPIRKENKIIGAVVTFSDITERKKNEEEIKSLSKFPSENPSPVLRVDNYGTILFSNKPGFVILDLWGIQVGQPIPKDWQEHLSDVVRSDLNKNYEIKCNNQIFSITLAPVKEERYVNLYGRDITDQKKLEDALIQSEKLKSIGTITTGIAHEFNNILAIISGNVQLMEKEYKDHEELTNALRTIKKATGDGAEISSKMLKFAKTGEDNKEFVSFDLKVMIKQSIEFTMPRWKNMAQANGIDYQMNTDGIKNIAPIMCNPTEMRKLFINIINNALDAMPDGGSLSFKTWSSKDTVFVSITDTGKGMTEDVMKNIFDPFFTTRRPEGTGLGMSIAYSTIKSHGGKIEVESEVGKGSTVTLQFPVATETAGPIITPEPEQEIKGRNLSILVVDDKEAICRILDKTLSRQGHKVKTVDNGTDAIEIIKKKSFDLVLCDLVMPNVSGYDVIKALHKLEMTPKIGIITGWGVKLKPVDEGELKVDFILKKPFDFSELTKYINDVVFSTE